MKALILDGDEAKITTRLEDVRAAYEAGKRFWCELDVHDEAGDAVLAMLQIHPLVVDDVWADIGLPKIVDYESFVQLVMHGVREADRDVRDVPLQLAELDILVGQDWVVTHTHDEKVCGVDAVIEEVKRNARVLKRGPAWIAHALLDRLVDEYMPLIDRFDTQIEEVEERILSGTLSGDRVTLGNILRIKRSLQMLRRTTIYQREVLLRLARGEFDEIPPEMVPFYRDVYDHFARITELVDSYRELVTSLLEAHFSMQSNRMNLIMKRLTIISTVMLPLSLIAGIYGMNFRKTFPELDWQYGYYYALGLMAAVAIAIVAFFKVQKWI
jgi:magnesium transporter